jgi:16S rRNA (cytosine1402-N4)-methyltransferase
MGEPAPHQPVLYNEIIHFLKPRDAGKYVDGTLGGGGHAFGILEASAPNGRLLGLDLDPAAIEIASKRLAEFGSRTVLIRVSYTTLRAQLEHLGWDKVDGILLDLGLSTMQLDSTERGFSFQVDAPLDMRFDPNNTVSAADLVNNLSVEELANLLYRYGEERHSYRVAKAITAARPIISTRQLAEIVAGATRGGRPGLHPATRTFQALRIAVNRELNSLSEALPQAITSLREGGRLAVIAYHSLEDRIVKHYYRQESTDCLCPPGQPVCNCGHRASIHVITRHPVRPGEDEVRANPRSRSARLRVAEKLSI